MLRQTTQQLITALYPRLSHEDELQARAIPFPTKRGFWKPMPNRMDFLICAGTPTTVIPVRTFKDPDFKPCLQTLKQGKSGQLSSRICEVRAKLLTGGNVHRNDFPTERCPLHRYQ